MRLLIIGPIVDRIEDVRNFSGVWAFYLLREFRRMGVDCSDILQPIHKGTISDKERIEHHKAIDVSSYDHVLALGTRYFDRLPSACGEILQSKMNKKGKGLVCQIHDGPTRKSPCDVTFHIKPDNPFLSGTHGGSTNANVPIGWAADPLLFYPEQHGGLTRILIDHAQLEGGEPDDYTVAMIEQAQAFASSIYREQPVLIRWIMDGGVATIDPGKPIEPKPYKRKTIPLLDIAQEYRLADIFVVTHPESVGFSVLETAMCGALPVIPRKAVSSKLLRTVRSYNTRDGRIDWNEVMGMLSPDLSRRKALMNDWSEVARKIIDHLEAFT
jgi:hypothetical protein